MDNGYRLIAHRQGTNTLIGRMGPRSPHRDEWPCVALSLPPILHGRVEYFPATLGDLHDQFERRGAPLADALFDGVRSLCENGRLQKPSSEISVLVLSVGLLREAGGTPERTAEIGFVVGANIADLGVAMGVLEKVDSAKLGNGRRNPGSSDTTYLAVNLIGGASIERRDWRDVGVEPLMVIPAFTPELGRRMSGIPEAGPKGTLAGVGALGSQMFDLWARSGWGRWTVIDPDHVKPHNLARHRAFECHVGVNKADVITELVRSVYATQPAVTRGIVDRATNVKSLEVCEALDSSDVVVDVTTDLGFPRMIAARHSVKRALSVFITPSGLGAVMLLEDAGRAIRLDALECQYYRQVISQSWGARHLAGNQGHLWTGAGCRDVSAVIPNELIAMHGGNLARMARTRMAAPEAGLLVWHYEPCDGSVCASSYDPVVPLVSSLDGLKIVWDGAVRARVRGQREACLPNETGGVLLGYFDLALGAVFIVDAQSAPADSRAERTGFIRGIEGLEASVNEAARRTANIVRYVGEWHSHPRDHTSQPSGLDIILLAHLARALDADGLPALMLIVGESEESWIAGRVA